MLNTQNLTEKVCPLTMYGETKKTLYLLCVSNYVFSTKVLIWDTVFMSLTGDRMPFYMAIRDTRR